MKTLLKLSSIFLSIIFSLFAANISTAATFDYNKTTHLMTINGDINPNDFNIFVKAIDDNKLDKIIITSNGGSMIDSFEIGLVVNANKITVDARNFCFSGCAYIWLASPNKILSVTDPNITMGMPYVGIHLPYSATDGKTDALSTAEAAWYFGKIGLSTKAVEDLLTSSYPNMFVIGPDSVQNWNIGPVKVENLIPKTVPDTTEKVPVVKSKLPKKEK